ncbi:MAG TPA: hypothetical protein VMW29_03810 [Candidatus Bathyarchaeia archaeon]|nr:hypothetical protein [Candidatus Bathyarchaeia archaeon]
MKEQPVESQTLEEAIMYGLLGGLSGGSGSPEQRRGGLELLRTHYMDAQRRIRAIVNNIYNSRTCLGGGYGETLKVLKVDCVRLYEDFRTVECLGPHLGINPWYNLEILRVFASKIASAAGKKSANDPVEENYHALAARYGRTLQLSKKYQLPQGAEVAGQTHRGEGFRTIEELEAQYLSAQIRIVGVVNSIYKQKICFGGPRPVAFKSLGAEPKELYEAFGKMEELGPYLGVNPWYNLATLYTYALVIGSTEETRNTSGPGETTCMSLAARYFQTLEFHGQNGYTLSQVESFVPIQTLTDMAVGQFHSNL